MDLRELTILHEREFPSSYYSAKQLLEQSARGEAIVLLSEAATGEIEGYVAGRVQPDGEGYVDFLAVDPSARRRGLGRSLMLELTSRLLARATAPRICLTVRDSFGPARALYDSLGFRLDASIVGYRATRQG